MTYARRLLPVAMLVTALPFTAAAQHSPTHSRTMDLAVVDTAAPAGPAVSVPTADTPAAPSLAASAVAVRDLSSERAGIALQQRSGSSKPVALMIVGGAAIVIGSVIGDDAGALFMIGGAVALLYGLYHYLR